MTKKARLANGRGLFIHIWVWGPGQCHLLSLTEHPPKGSVIPVIKSNGYYQPSLYLSSQQIPKDCISIELAKKFVPFFCKMLLKTWMNFLVKPIKWYSFFFTLPKWSCPFHDFKHHVCVLVTQSCPTLKDCSPLGYSPSGRKESDTTEAT